MQLKRLLWITILTLAGAAGMWAQGFTASVSGVVTDNTGAVVPHAQVTVTNTGTGVQQIFASDDTGNYLAPQLQPGTYRIAVEVQGFKRTVREPLTLEVDQRLRLDFPLEVGQVTENVTVSAEATQVQAETANVGATVTKTQVAELPVNGRNFLALNLLIPGAAADSPSAGGVNTQGGNGGGGIVVHGLPDSSNYFWLDGADNTSQAIGQYIVAIPLHAIEEFKVMSPAYDAEFGRNPGAQINTILKSGTNSYHGDIYALFRNSIFDAKNFFDPPGRIPAFRRGQYGADLGGRLKRDKLFFYIGFEGQNYAQGTSTSVLVPTHQETLGNFSDISTIIRDPLNQAPFGGNVIPANRLTTVGLAYAAFYPLPNAGTNTANLSPILTDKDNNYLFKLDWTLSPKNRLSFFWDLEDIYSHQPLSAFSGNQLPPFGIDIRDAHDIITGISDTHLFSPTLISDVRFGWNSGAFPYFAIVRDKDYCALYGIQGCRPGPKNWYPPTMNLNGVYAAVGGGNNQYGPFDTTFLNPAVTWVKGKHTMKFGGNYDHFFVNNNFNEGPGGSFTFRGTYSGNPLADMLLALPFSATFLAYQNNSPQFLMTANQMGFFAQDDIRLRSHLTATVGLRWDYQFPITERQNRMTNYDLTKGVANATPITAGVNGRGSTVYNSNTHEFAPRFGIAWSPNERWAVRGGFGMFFQTVNWSSSIALRQNPPFTANYTIVGDGKTITTNNAFVTGLAANVPGVTAFNLNNMKYGYVEEFSIGVQHRLGPGLLLDVGYVGNRGKDLMGTTQANTPNPGPGTVQTRRPNVNFANIAVYGGAFSSQYDGLEVRLEKRFTAGSNILLSYTLSRALSNTTLQQDPHDFSVGAWGPIPADTPQHLAFSYVYQLPVGKGRTFLSNLHGIGQGVLGGWQLNGILQLHSGLPFTATNGQDNINNLINNGWPNVVGDPYQSSGTCHTRTPSCWVNAAAFATPPLYSFGNETEGFLRGPGFGSLDFSVSKNFPILESKKLEFRAEAFNILNHPNFLNPGSALVSSFGVITRAQASRQMQFALRFAF